MNLLVTGAWNGAKEHIPELEAMGHSVAFMQQETERLPCAPEWVDGVIGNGFFLYHSIGDFTNLRYIQLISAGFDRAPLDEIMARGIEIHNARGVYSIPMAEFALCEVLQLYKQVAAFCESQRAHKWEKRRGLLELYGKTVMIIGCGSVGTECAKRFAAFGCEVVGVTTDGRENTACTLTLPMARLDEALPRADIVVLTLPLTERTSRLMDKRRLAMLKNGAVLVNLARGEIMETAALLGELDRLGGAVLDVFEEEPLSKDSPLWDMENVILTPHNSFVGEGNANRLAGVILKNLADRKGRENNENK